jgi:hypothetical protein
MLRGPPRKKGRPGEIPARPDTRKPGTALLLTLGGLPGRLTLIRN